MKLLFALLLTVAFAGSPRGAFIKDHHIARMVAAPDAKYKAAMAADGYSYIDVSNKIGVSEGDTCVKCDGTDFVPAPPEVSE